MDQWSVCGSKTPSRSMQVPFFILRLLVVQTETPTIVRLLTSELFMSDGYRGLLKSSWLHED